MELVTVRVRLKLGMNRTKLLKLLRQQNLYLIEQSQVGKLNPDRCKDRVRSNVRLIRQLTRGLESTELYEAYRSLTTFGPYR